MKDINFGPAATTIEAKRTHAHEGGVDCFACHRTMRERGVIWWHGCELHGVTDCPCCHKHPGQCDFGSCIQPAAVMVRLAAGGGRWMCEQCADLVRRMGWVTTTSGGES
ncbi:MAG TPA: hypothetical protein VOB72_04765 [Candidatus Dormibacteraeota bacterium]|nr:hypothetical protein [Candidatus Dormibacteraeota bacterium]